MVVVILRLERMMRKNGHARQQQTGAQDQNSLPGCHLPTSRLKSANSLSAKDSTSWGRHVKRLTRYAPFCPVLERVGGWGSWPRLYTRMVRRNSITTVPS